MGRGGVEPDAVVLDAEPTRPRPTSRRARRRARRRPRAWRRSAGPRGSRRTARSRPRAPAARRPRRSIRSGRPVCRHAVRRATTTPSASSAAGACAVGDAAQVLDDEVDLLTEGVERPCPAVPPSASSAARCRCTRRATSRCWALSCRSRWMRRRSLSAASTASPARAAQLVLEAPGANGDERGLLGRAQQLGLIGDRPVRRQRGHRAARRTR